MADYWLAPSPYLAPAWAGTEMQAAARLVRFIAGFMPWLLRARVRVLTADLARTTKARADAEREVMKLQREQHELLEWVRGTSEFAAARDSLSKVASQARVSQAYVPEFRVLEIAVRTGEFRFHIPEDHAAYWRGLGTIDPLRRMLVSEITTGLRDLVDATARDVAEQAAKGRGCHVRSY